mgnify:CR=1 FL=1
MLHPSVAKVIHRKEKAHHLVGFFLLNLKLNFGGMFPRA